MLCSRERGCTVQVRVGDVNKAFIVETERQASTAHFVTSLLPDEK